MVDAAKAFAKEPPKRPLVDLYAVVEDFKWRYKDRKKTDQVIEFCKYAGSFAEAVDRAVRARDEQGKHHNHQSKVDLQARLFFGDRITVRSRQFTRVGVTFDHMHDVLEALAPVGIGPVTTYDVAVRIGAYLRIEPHSVYMHAGVRQGMKALWRAMGYESMVWRWKRVPMEALPEPLRRMKADDVEDILCTYRQVFEGWRNE